MAGLKKEYRCWAHGFFEATEPRCPHGCSVVADRAFLTAPAAISKKTSNTDRLLRQLANDFGLSDMSNRSGAVAGGAKRMDLRPTWGEIPKGDQMVVGKGVVPVKGGKGGATAAAEAYKVHGDGNLAASTPEHVTLQDVAKTMKQPRPIVDRKLSFGNAAVLQDAIRKVAA